MGIFGVLYEGDTDFNHYQIADTLYQGRPARVLYSGNNDAAQSGVARDGKPELLFDYNQRFMEIIRGTAPDSVLLLGGGAFTLPTAVLTELPQIRMDIVELDDGLLELARQYFDFQPNDRTRVFIDDGVHFLRTHNEKYDLIIVDVFSHASIPESFQTLAFVQNLKQCVGKKGRVAMNIIASLDGVRSLVLRRIHEAMQATFPEVRVFAATRHLSPWISQNYIIVAGNNGTDDVAGYLMSDPVQLTA
jgi:spermidine synthase